MSLGSKHNHPISNHGSDSPIEDIQAEIDALKAFGANQMPDKHKEIDLLAKAYKEQEGTVYVKICSVFFIALQ